MSILGELRGYQHLIKCFRRGEIPPPPPPPQKKRRYETNPVTNSCSYHNVVQNGCNQSLEITATYVESSGTGFASEMDSSLSSSLSLKAAPLCYDYSLAGAQVFVFSFAWTSLFAWLLTFHRQRKLLTASIQNSVIQVWPYSGGTKNAKSVQCV